LRRHRSEDFSQPRFKRWDDGEREETSSRISEEHFTRYRRIPFDTLP
jgi:hypothetical protein